MYMKGIKKAAPAPLCDPAGTRTQGPNIKSVVLYQLSYEINPICKINFKNLCDPAGLQPTGPPD